MLDSIAETTGIERARDAVLLDRVQEGPAALFHRRVPALGGGARGLSDAPLVAARHALGRALPARAGRPPGRRELAGAGDARDRPRPDLHRARRRAPRSSTSTATRYVDYVCSWGPLIPAMRTRRCSRRSTAAAARGTSSARRRPARSSWPRRSCARMPARRDAAHDVLGHRGGDERDPAGARRHRSRRRCSSSPAPTTATSTGCSPRRARASPRRGSRLRRACRGAAARHRGRAVERRRGGAGRVRRAELAAVLCRAVPGQHGSRPARGGFLELLRELATEPALCSCSTRSSPASGSRRAARRS